MIQLLLYVEFFKIGLFTVGGAMAVIPFLYELSDKHQWFTYAEITNMIAISESTPGPIGINMATYVGFHVGGVAGGVLATLGTITPGIIIVLVVAKYMERFIQSKYVQAGLYGIRPAVVALISVALLTVMRSSLLNWDAFLPGRHWDRLVHPSAVILFVAAFVLIRKLKKHPLWYILGGAVIGMLVAPI